MNKETNQGICAQRAAGEAHFRECRLKSENEEARSTRKSVLGRGNGMGRDPEVGKRLKRWRFVLIKCMKIPKAPSLRKGVEKSQI